MTDVNFSEIKLRQLYLFLFIRSDTGWQTSLHYLPISMPEDKQLVYDSPSTVKLILIKAIVNIYIFFEISLLNVFLISIYEKYVKLDTREI